MVLDASPDLDRVFHALAHPARRLMVRRLASGEQNLSALAAPLKMSFPAASKHVRVLEEARLVKRRVAGREHICRLHAGPLKEIAEWTEQFRKHWEARFEVLDALLEEMKAAEGTPAAAPRSKKRKRSSNPASQSATSQLATNLPATNRPAAKRAAKAAPAARGRSARPRRGT